MVFSTNKTDRHDVAIVESGVKHHNPNTTEQLNRHQKRFRMIIYKNALEMIKLK
jgi:hypothetical protein